MLAVLVIAYSRKGLDVSKAGQDATAEVTVIGLIGFNRSFVYLFILPSVPLNLLSSFFDMGIAISLGVSAPSRNRSHVV